MLIVGSKPVKGHSVPKVIVNAQVARLKQLASPAWAMIEYGSYPLLLFIATPWFLHQLGTSGYGHWMLLIAAVGFGGALNAGTGAATIKAVSGGIGRAAIADIEHAVRVSLAIAILGGGTLALTVFSVFWFAGASLLARMGDPDLIRLTGTAAAALIWLEQIDNVFSSAMKGAELFSHAARIEITSKTTQVVAAAVVLWIWPNLRALYIALLSVAILRLLAKTVIARRLLKLKSVWPTLVHANAIMRFAKWGWLQGVGSMLLGVADRMLVGSLLGASSLTYYSVATQLATQVHAASAAGLSVIFPKISRKLESDGHFSLWRVSKLTMAGNLLLSTLLGGILLLFGPMILRAWIGADAAPHAAQILPWLVIAYWVLALNIVPYYLLLAMGRMRLVGISVVCSGILSAVVTYYAISRAGIIGAPLGRGVYSLLALLLILPSAGRVLRAHRMKDASRQMAPRFDQGSLQ